jgi:hypothetical protein
MPANDVALGHLRNRQVAETRLDLLLDQLDIIGHGARLELWAHVFGQPPIGELRDGDGAGGARRNPDCLFTGRVFARANRVERVAGLAPGVRHRHLRMLPDRHLAGLSAHAGLHQEDFPAGRRHPQGEARHHGVEYDIIAPIDGERSDLGLR